MTTDNNLTIGGNGDGTNKFGGILDELLIMDKALTADQIYMLAQDGVSNVGTVELALEPVNFSTLSDPLDESAQTWQAATLDQTGTTASQWSYTIPNSGLQNYYRLHLRSQDSAGNRETAVTIWNGLIDHVPPTVSASGVQGWVGTTAVTTYTYTFADFLLNDNRYTQPCSVGGPR